MPEDLHNSGAPPAARDSEHDAHGKAALLLTESLIHRLVADGTVSALAAVEIADAAIDVEYDLAQERELLPVADQSAARLLQTISNSLRTDLHE